MTDKEKWESIETYIKGLLAVDTPMQECIDNIIDFDDKCTVYFSKPVYDHAVEAYTKVKAEVEAQKESIVEKVRSTAPDFYFIPSYFIGELTSYILNTAPVPQENLALGAAIALTATVACNRYRYGSIWPNLYILNVAHSGMGKERPQEVIPQILNEINHPYLVGTDYYTSEKAVLVGLKDEANVRIDIIDEAGGFLKAANDMTGRSYQYNISNLLSKLWSKSASEYLGRVSAMDGKHGAVKHPCVNILASTTPKGFQEAITGADYEKGFMARFLVFGSNTRKKPLLNLAESGFPMSDKLKSMLNWTPVVSLRGKQADPIDLRKRCTCIDDIDQILDRFGDDRLAEDPNNPFLPVLNRSGQQFIKLAIIHYASRCIASKTFQDLTLDKEDIDWAFEVITSLLKDMRKFMDGNLDCSMIESVERLIKTSGDKGLRKIDILRGLGGVHSVYSIDSALKALENDNIITKTKDSRNSPGRRPFLFRIA
jgi:hypothetical protein